MSTPELRRLRVRAHLDGPTEAPERPDAKPSRRAVVLHRAGSFAVMVELDAGHVIGEGVFALAGDVDALRTWACGRRSAAPAGLGAGRLVVGDAVALSKRIENRSHRVGVPLCGWDLAPMFAGLAEHVGKARGDGFSLALQGLRFTGDDGVERDDVDRGRVRLRPRGPLDAGAFASWTVPRDRAGSDRPRPPRPFVDLRQLVAALAGGDSEDAQNACRWFGIEWPAGITDQRERVRAETAALAKLYIAALAELAELAPGLAPERVWSGGSLAGHLFARAGVTPWQAKAGHMPARLHGAMAASFRGGRVEARLLGVAMPMALLDITATYPSTFSLLGLTNLLAAGRVEALDVSEDLRSFLASPDLLDRLYDRQTWQRWGATFAIVRPRGEVLPSTIEWTPNRVGGTVAPLDMGGATLPFHWCDLAAAVVEGGRAPEVIDAWCLAPGPPAAGLKPLRLPSGASVDLATGDLGAGFLAERERWRADDSLAGRRRLAMAKGLDVAATFGQLARVDVVHRTIPVEVVGIGPSGERLAATTARPERPGPWCALPLASAVCAGARLLIALAVRAVSDAGGVVAHIATDSVAVPASPGGGVVDPCPGAPGHEVRLLPWAECRSIVERFAALGVRWKPENGTLDQPTVGLVVGVNKLLLGRPDADGELRLVRSSDADFGHLVDPSGNGERLADGRMAWVAETEGAILRAAVGVPDLDRPLRAGDLPGWAGRPAIRPWAATTWSELEAMREELGMPDLAPYTPLLRAVTGGDRGGPVAVDDGSGPEGWRVLDWRRGGEPVTIATLDHRGELVPVGGSGRLRVHALSVADHLARWLRENDASMAGPARGLRQPVPVCSGPGLVVVVGKDGGRLDAADDDSDATDQVCYGVAGLAELLAQVERVGVPTVAAASGVAERTLRDLVGGTTRAPRASTVARLAGALAVLDAGRDGGDVTRCAAPGCERPARPAPSSTCGEPCRKAVARDRIAADPESAPVPAQPLEADPDGTVTGCPVPELIDGVPWYEALAVVKPADRMWLDREPAWTYREPEGDGVDWEALGVGS